MLGASKQGLVITRFGQHADIEDLETGEVQAVTYVAALSLWFLVTECSGVKVLNQWQASQVLLKP